MTSQGQVSDTSENYSKLYCMQDETGEINV